MAKIRKGDTVAVLTGKDRGKTGKVLRVWPQAGTALVERLNFRKHFERRSQQNPSGGIVEREHALALSKLALMCPKCKKPTRVGWRSPERVPQTAGRVEGSITRDTKQRVCRRCHEPLMEQG